MPRLFNPPNQMGIVVRDLETVLKHWIEDLGVGPWFLTENLPMQRYAYRGKEYAAPKMSMAVAHYGDIQVELIQPRDATPTAWSEFLAAGQEGMNHWCSYETDYEGVYERARQRGMEAVMEGTLSRGKFAYLRHPAAPNMYVEIAESHPDRLKLFQRIKEAALGWDGSNPVRLGPPSLHDAP